MKSFFKTLSFVGVLSVSFVAPSFASVFVWQDPQSGVSVSFPDRWAVVSNKDTHDVLTVRAPGEYDYASCKVSAKTDARFAIYPRKFADNIQRVALNDHYWNEHYASVNDTVFHSVQDNKGLGRGFASMAEVSYETAPDALHGLKMQKRGIAFASLYDNTLYTVECSAQASSYHKWHDAFLSFVKSVDFKQKTNYALTGYYRNFMDDCILKVRGPHFADDTYY